MTKDELNSWLDFVRAHPHDFTIQYPPRREYFQQYFRRAPAPSVRDWFSTRGKYLLYLHVPFCEAKCYYCNFAVDMSNDLQTHREYTDALLRELESHADWLADSDGSEDGKNLHACDIGGGTPTRLPASELDRILRALRPLLRSSQHPFPLSIETTPRIASQEPEKLAVLREGGVDRVSLGVQSFNSETLASVNRGRQVEQTESAIRNLRAAGFSRVNLDVIFALPGQSIADWRRDLEHLIALRPDSITTYDCLYRGKGRALTRRTPVLPAPELYGEMYDLGYSMLTQAGWHAPYGSVNFARNPEETGTSAYFEGRLLDGLPYLGLGNYSSSLLRNQWSFNAHGAREYVNRIAAYRSAIEFHYELPTDESMAKYVLASLNFGFVDEERFTRRFGATLEESFARELAHASDAGWLKPTANRWCVAPGEFRNMHLVRSLFYSHRARRWLMDLSAMDSKRTSGTMSHSQAALFDARPE